MKRFLYNWIAQFCNPLRLIKGFQGLLWFWGDFSRYKRLPGSEPLKIKDTWPALHERSSDHELDAQYFYVNAWAMRRIHLNRPGQHIDIGAQTILAGLLSATVPVTYIDYRALTVRLDGLTCVCGSIQALPYRDNSIESLSCLHVAEHVGLGRYGDTLDPDGTRKACNELKRVLARDGNLYFAVPVGRERVCFNAHRVHAPETIIGYFDELELMEFSGVNENGVFIDNANIKEFQAVSYALGIFWFKKR